MPQVSDLRWPSPHFSSTSDHTDKNVTSYNFISQGFKVIKPRMVMFSDVCLFWLWSMPLRYGQKCFYLSLKVNHTNVMPFQFLMLFPLIFQGLPLLCSFNAAESRSWSNRKPELGRERERFTVVLPFIFLLKAKDELNMNQSSGMRKVFHTLVPVGRLKTGFFFLWYVNNSQVWDFPSSDYLPCTMTKKALTQNELWHVHLLIW